MVRETLERCGLPMQGCPPMFYEDAIKNLASILGRAAGMEKWIDVQRFVAEHEAARAEIAPPNPGNAVDVSRGVPRGPGGEPPSE